jgi:hypothetical protein
MTVRFGPAAGQVGHAVRDAGPSRRRAGGPIACRQPLAALRRLVRDTTLGILAQPPVLAPQPLGQLDRLVRRASTARRPWSAASPWVANRGTAASGISGQPSIRSASDSRLCSARADTTAQPWQSRAGAAWQANAPGGCSQVSPSYGRSFSYSASLQTPDGTSRR